MKESRMVIPREQIEQRIYLLRGEKVMLSTDLARLYRVAPRVLVQAVKRNLDRFPVDFMFQLTQAESQNLKSQIVTSSWGGLRRATPYAFTEEGVAMLSSVLRSKRAVHVNIEIMRTFARIRKMIASNHELARKLELLERKYDAEFKVVSDAIRELMVPPEHKGVILLRLGDERTENEIRVLRKLFAGYAEQLCGQFVVVTEKRVRFAGSGNR